MLFQTRFLYCGLRPILLRNSAHKLLPPLHRCITTDFKQPARFCHPLFKTTSRHLRHFSSPPSTEKKGKKKQLSTASKVLRGTKSATIVLIRCFTHPRQSWRGFKEGWHHFVDTLKHYWKGAKLLWAEMKACSGILWEVLTRGHTPTWREKRQLQRTAIDMLKFIPMFFFIVIPALEIFLPLALYLFPSMLPSTFATKNQKEDRQKKLLRIRLEQAEFLKNIHSKYLERIDDEANQSVVKNILKKFQRNQTISEEEIGVIAPYFRDHITLDSLTTSQLTNICRYMNINAIGSDAMLRTRLDNRIKSIRKEDSGIAWTGGVDSLQNNEVVSLLQERGMRVDKTMFDSRRDLANWIELTQAKKMPASLLLLSRTLMVSAGAQETTQQIASVLKDLPDAVDEVLVDSLMEDDPEIKKKTTDRQTRIIQEEKQERKKAVQKPGPDQQEAQKEKDLKEKQKLVEFVKIATDDSAVKKEKERLRKIQSQVEAAKGKLDRSDNYLENWEMLLQREDLDGKSELSFKEVKKIWKAHHVELPDFEEHFKRWDVNQDGILSAKRAWLLLDEALQMKSESIPISFGDVISEVGEETEEEREERKTIKKTASKVSEKLQKMFDKLEKDISKSDQKIGSSLKTLPVEDCTPEKIKEIIHQEYAGEANSRLVEEVLKSFGIDDNPQEIKQKIDAQASKFELQSDEEEKEEMDISDVEDDEPDLSSVNFHVETDTDNLDDDSHQTR